MLEQALEYLRRGWSVLPLRKGTKSPAVLWTEYQHRLPTEAEVRSWDWSNGLGFVTGPVSGFVVLDIDEKAGGYESLNRHLGDVAATLPTVRTGGGGAHWYYAAPAHGSIRNFAGRFKGVDFRGASGFVVGPPSIHPVTGRPYEWVCDKVRPMPASVQSLLNQASAGQKVSSFNLEEILPGVVNGRRNDAAAKLAGYLFAKGLVRPLVEMTMRGWNENNQPPLDEAELNQVITSIERIDGRRRGVPAGEKSTVGFV